MVKNTLRKTVNRAVRRDFSRFRASMYRKPQPEVWEASGRIHFYCCVFEYFQYNDQIPMKYYALLSSCRRPIYSLWETYLRYEHLSYLTWEDIDGVIEMLLEKNRRASSERRLGDHGYNQDIAC